MTQDVLVYNHVVTKQIKAMEGAVTHEITSVQTELEKEEVRRVNNDKLLLGSVKDFLENLQNPRIRSQQQMEKYLNEQKQEIIKVNSKEHLGDVATEKPSRDESSFDIALL